MTTTLRGAAAEYLLNTDGSVDLYVREEKALRLGETVSVPRLPTKRLQYAVMAELGDAVRRGAAHGVCDRERELADALNGVDTPGHVDYSRGRREWGSFVPGGIWRYVDGEETPLFDGIAVRPRYLKGFIVNELERAFRVGGLYGAEGAPVVHLTRIVTGSSPVTGGFPHTDIYGAPVEQTGWFADAYCTRLGLRYTDTDVDRARAAARSHREEMQAAGHLVGIDR